MKVLSALFKEPFVARWNEIKEIILRPSVEKGKPPNSYFAAVRLASGRQIKFSGVTVGDRFLSELAARRLYALLLIASRRLGSGQSDLSSRNSEVAEVLAADWPDGTEYRRTIASKIGVAIGGSLAIVSGALLILGPRGQVLVWRGVFIGGGFIGLWAALSPHFLRNVVKRLHLRR